ncbi:MAG: hypothetical protein LBH16_10860 [Treponema sp.]|jgi:hypothetical protein|nr:hypothetical protein [Treponema sp.]
MNAIKASVDKDIPVLAWGIDNVIYILDSHPFYMIFNEEKLKENKNGQYHFPHFDKKLPFTFSLKAKLK